MSKFIKVTEVNWNFSGDKETKVMYINADYILKIYTAKATRDKQEYTCISYSILATNSILVEESMEELIEQIK